MPAEVPRDCAGMRSASNLMSSIKCPRRGEEIDQAGETQCESHMQHST